MSVASTDLLQSVVSPLSFGTVQKKYTRYHQAYYYGFLIALVFCWSPSKLAAYLVPWVGLFVFLLLSRSLSSLIRLTVVFVIWLAILPIYALLTPEFAVSSAVLSLLTYGAIIFIFVIPTKRLVHVKLSDNMLSVARWVLLFQGSWGIGQGLASFARRGTFDGSTGDAVAGTIRPFSLVSDFSNPMFAVNIVLLLLVLLPSLVKDRKGMFVLGIGLLSLIMASVLHVLIFMSIAIAAAFILCFPSFFLRKRGIYLLIGALLSGVIAFNLLSSNFVSVRSFAQYTLDGKTTRAQVVTDVFTRMPQTYFWMPVIGLGPGQFTSRASLIGTGLYFGGPKNPRSIPFLPQGMSLPFREYILGPWISLASNGINNSSTSQPYFSWLSVFTEFGAVGFLLVTVVVMKILFKLQRLSSVARPGEKIIAVSLSAAIIFLFVLGVQENYWEVSQAIFVGLMLLKLQYANLVYADREKSVTG